MIPASAVGRRTLRFAKSGSWMPFAQSLNGEEWRVGRVAAD